MLNKLSFLATDGAYDCEKRFVFGNVASNCVRCLAIYYIIYLTFVWGGVIYCTKLKNAG